MNARRVLRRIRDLGGEVVRQKGSHVRASGPASASPRYRNTAPGTSRPGPCGPSSGNSRRASARAGSGRS